MLVDMPVVAWLALFVLVPVVAGYVAGLFVRVGEGYRRIPAVAGCCTLVIVAVVLIAGYAATPASRCGGTACDTGPAVGAAVLAVPVFLLALAGVVVGRRFAARRNTTGRITDF